MLDRVQNIVYTINNLGKSKYFKAMNQVSKRKIKTRFLKEPQARFIYSSE
ncbi:MAG: hypothetical protein NTW06_01695 [Candidatus Falkowbacteria bacterium]|nr:hypothetical protein [Candidatus Falkowbacteria bacterium]